MLKPDEYLSQISLLCEQLQANEATLLKLVDDIITRVSNGRVIIVFGNGGSATTASHFICDLCKGPRPAPNRPQIKGMSLTDNTSMLTAWANDDCYDSIFAKQLETYGQFGDLVIAISGSGNSPNVINGVNTAKSMGITSVGLCGFDGGKLAKTADYAIIVPTDSIQYAEDLHLILLHIVSIMVQERLSLKP